MLRLTQIDSLSTLVPLWASILTGIIFSIFIPIFTLVNVYAASQNASFFIENALRTDQINASMDIEGYQDISQKLRCSLSVSHDSFLDLIEGLYRG